MFGSATLLALVLASPLLGLTTPFDSSIHSTESMLRPPSNVSVTHNSLDPECHAIWTASPSLKQNQCDGLVAHFHAWERRHELLDIDVANAPYRFVTTREEQVEANRPCMVTVFATDSAQDDQFTYGDLAVYVYKIMNTCRGGLGRDSRGGWIRMTTNGRRWSGFALRVDAYPPRPPFIDNFLLDARDSSSTVPTATSPPPAPPLNATVSTREVPSPSCFSTHFSHFPELRPHQCDRLLANIMSPENRHLHVTLDDAHDTYTLNVDARTSPRQCTITIKSVVRGARDDFTFYDIAKFGEAIYERCRGGFWGLSRGGEIPMRFVGQRQTAGFRLRLSGELPPRSSTPSIDSS